MTPSSLHVKLQLEENICTIEIKNSQVFGFLPKNSELGQIECIPYILHHLKAAYL